MHPEISEIAMERHMMETRYPELDIDAMVQRYVDRLETHIGLLEKGYYFKKYLQVLGVLRDWRRDCALLGLHRRNPWIKTADDVKKAFADELVNKFRKASPEARFQAYLNRDNAILENKGQADLIGPMTALKTIKFIKQRLQEALEEEKKPDDSETEEV
jgi:hypothetical protein